MRGQNSPNHPTASKMNTTNSFQDAFTSSLLSNIAPLTTLFGEQVSKQFLSQMAGIEDCITFSMAPIGVLTAVVSTIRLTSTKRLRAFVGRFEPSLLQPLRLRLEDAHNLNRARENKATAEKELLSTTSDTICEMWDADGIGNH